MAERGHDPWRTLRSRGHITLLFDPIAAECGGALYASRDGRAVIAIDPSLDRVGRNAALAHELTHDDGLVNEERVENAVAQWLVPFEDLHAMWTVAVLNDLPVEVWQVAEKFDVPDHVAERAMRLFLGARRAS